MKKISSQWLLDNYKDLDWGRFEETFFGNRLLLVSPFRLCRFSMRVGLHLRRPTQVIITQGTFIKMRPAKRFENLPLKTIDVNNPDGCLYEDGWDPIFHMPRWPDSPGQVVYPGTSTT